jgi:hypothetical protein
MNLNAPHRQLMEDVLEIGNGLPLASLADTRFRCISLSIGLAVTST